MHIRFKSVTAVGPTPDDVAINHILQTVEKSLGYNN